MPFTLHQSDQLIATHHASAKAAHEIPGFWDEKIREVHRMTTEERLRVLSHQSLDGAAVAIAQSGGRLSDGGGAGENQGK
jgi:hypothetical protein